MGTLCIGGVLILVAVVLAVEVKSLLVGERADPSIERAIRELAAEQPRIRGVLRIITVQQGPGQVMVAMKLRVEPGLTTGGELCELINDFERKLEARLPEVRWTFIEPDVAE